jgi:hypothetical protein
VIEMDIPWILVSIAFTVVILAILVVLIYKRKGWKRKVDYRSYFNMGIIWFPLGIVFYLIFKSVVGFWFLFMGLVYLAIGLKNKEKWGKPEEVSPKYQKIMWIAILIGMIILILGIIVFEMLS